MSRRAKQIFWTGVFTLLILGLWAFWWEPSTLTVVHQTIAIRPWYPEHAGLKLAVMADLHPAAPHLERRKLNEVAATTNAQKPDLIVILRDSVIHPVLGGHFVNPEPIAAELAELEAPLGVVAVLGNHDWWYNGERVRRALEAQGIHVLENQNLPLTYRGRSFWLCGLADFWTRDDQLLATLAKIDNTEPVLILTHNPDIFPEVPEGVSLTLAGHTHGGQVNLPIVGRPIVPSRFGQRYAYGFVEEK